MWCSMSPIITLTVLKFFFHFKKGTVNIYISGITDKGTANIYTFSITDKMSRLGLNVALMNLLSRCFRYKYQMLPAQLE